MAKVSESRAVQRVREAMSYGKSAAQIAAGLGEDYDVAWVDATMRSLYEDFNGYDLQMKLGVAVDDLLEIAATAKDHFVNSSKPDPRMAQQATLALTAASERIQTVLDRTNEEVFALDQKQVTLLVELVNRVTFATMERMYDRHPELLASKDEFEAVVIAELEAAQGGKRDSE
jgi:hypothetical protein